MEGYEGRPDPEIFLTPRFFNLNDFAESAGRVFFGDRPLDDPGYTKFELSGVVSKANVVDTAAEALDVWRVEQRLAYLAFPAIGTGNPTAADNTIQDFKVDGKFAAQETAALKLFEKAVRYGPSLENRQFALASPGADGMIEADTSKGQGKITSDWLNAYNAPHWMQFFASVPNKKGSAFAATNPNLKGWINTQLGQNSPFDNKLSAVENFGTSWMYDLMAAKSDTQISQFNGSVDANLGKTPGMHVTHDLGMAFDLGVGIYIDRNRAQRKQNEPLTLSSDITKPINLRNTPFDTSIPYDPSIPLAEKDSLYGHIPNLTDYNNRIWNVDNANYLSGLLSDSTDPLNLNNQRAALRDFLSIYMLTRSDTTPSNGSWDELKFVNGEPVRKALFGSGAYVGDLISKIHIGGVKTYTNAQGDIVHENPYLNINDILYGLGIVPKDTVADDYSEVKGHQTHFHIYLNPPTWVPIDTTKHLLSNDAKETSADLSITPITLQTESKGLLAYAQTITNTGEEFMFTMDIPYVPVKDAPIVLAQAAVSGTGVGAKQPDYLLKECKEIPTLAPQISAERGIDPAGWLTVELENRSNRYIDEAITTTVKITLLESPTHGKLISLTSVSGRVYYRYDINDAEQGYEGKDKAVFMAEFEGKAYKVVVNLLIGAVAALPNESTCPAPTLIKLKTKPASGSTGYNLNSLSVTFANLDGGALGQATGTSITLDDNAAGHNWFIDTTPADNSEFLPTSNPNEWVAKEGTAAYGKMDMLSVLLHEYGHALGIEHSADGHDYMATTLTAGVRRLPSAEELALMQLLVGEVKVEMASVSTQGSGNTPSQLPLLPLGGFGLAFLGRLRGTRYGSLNIEADLSTLVTQYAVTANAKLTNGNFSVASGMPVDNGWATQGSVDFTPATGSGQSGFATLKEISTSQTRLNQVFVVNPRDRFLSFTIAGSVLDDVNGAPDDAFEAALLDANTGLSLAGALSLTHTDAMLNLQADGTETAASSVTRVTNADGSRTYRVDLAGIAVGTAVNLSFDLIGFGKDNSEITIRDVRVSGLPELHDDAATMDEDGSLAFDPFAQVDNAALLQLGSHVVDQPAHGIVTVNADGTFAYTPAADYFGTDTFTYRLNDGPLESNLATVSVSIAAVNDAPVAGDVYATLAEDTPLQITLGAHASDVDSTTLSIQIVAGPSHGVLITNADGSYTYTPEANYFGADSFTYKANDSELDSNIATVSLNITPVNDAPVANDVAVYTLEDNQLVLNLLSSASDIDSPVDAQVFTATIVAAPVHGVLSWNTDGSYTYTPDANYNGADSFTYVVNDGELDSNIATVSLTVGSVNDAPEGSSNTVTTLEDTPYVFQLADFGYSDANDLVGAQASRLQADGTSAIQWDNFSAVTIGSLPLAGELALNGVVVMAGQRISVAEIAAGLLAVAPAANANGASYASFSFNVQDDGGTANGGIDTDQTARTMTLNVTSVNDAPEGLDNTVTTLEDIPYVFQLADFDYSDANDLVGAQASRLQADGTSAIQWDNFTAVTISSLPLAGELALNGVVVMAGQRISVAEIAAGLLKFAPAANANGASYASFTFQVQDDGGTANGGVDIDQTARTMSIAVTAVNDAPVAVDMQAATLEDTPLTLNLLANVIDIDSTALTPIIIAGPQHGQLLYNADGSFNYVADLDYFGTDSFTYKVVDGDLANGGLESNIVTVSLNITAVNDAPVAVSATVTGAEDTPYIFSWSDFKVSDVDIDNLFIIINYLPLNGLLQFYDGLMPWRQDEGCQQH